jgi:hypothetical protein
MLNQPSLAPIPKFSLNNILNSHLITLISLSTSPTTKVQKRKEGKNLHIDLQPYSKGVLTKSLSQRLSSKMRLRGSHFHGNKFKG